MRNVREEKKKVNQQRNAEQRTKCVCVLFGESIVGASTALGGVSLEVSKIALEYAKKVHGFKVFRRDHPLS